MAKVKALFDFESGGPNELSFVGGELLTVVEQDIGGGWWEARNSQGRGGLIPISYVEVLSLPPTLPKKPAPPRPVSSAEASRRVSSGPTHQYQHQPAAVTLSHVTAQLAAGSAVAPCNNNTGTYDNSIDVNEWTDDEWDDDDDDDDDEDMQKSPVSEHIHGDDTSQGRSKAELMRSSRNSLQGTSTLRHRFSKSAADAFLFDETPAVPDTERIVISHDTYGPVWHADPAHMYTCVIASPKLAKKFHGMKSYIAYQLTPTFSNIQVTRRYKQFDWLHQRLTEKFTMIAIPPLPGKQIAGRFEDDFVSARLKQLQMWIDRVCKHPVVSHSEVFLHFLSCTDDKRWTAGKRKAEKDEFVGERLFFTVDPHVEKMPARYSETQVECFSQFVKSMDENVKHMHGTMERSAKNYEQSFSKHYKKVGQSFCGLARSFELDDRPESKALTAAVLSTSKTFEEIGDLYAKQPLNDVSHLMDGLQEYKGILSTFPYIMLIQRGIVTKLMDKEDSGKYSDAELEEAKSRTDVVTHSLMAEARHFHQHRVADFRHYVHTYLNAQVNFHKMIVSKLEAAARQYDSL